MGISLYLKHGHDADFLVKTIHNLVKFLTSFIKGTP